MPENSSHGIEMNGSRAIFGIRTESIFRLEPELAALTDKWNSLRFPDLSLHTVSNSTIQQTIDPRLIQHGLSNNKNSEKRQLDSDKAKRQQQATPLLMPRQGGFAYVPLHL